MNTFTKYLPNPGCSLETGVAVLDVKTGTYVATYTQDPGVHPQMIVPVVVRAPTNDVNRVCLRQTQKNESYAVTQRLLSLDDQIREIEIKRQERMKK
ncbi:hypothetical protein HN592_02810 [Candidatus Woesearchaeota archaeon]|jgi:hypothetical protein|nr:hypothetical protein [Candidatus Woesearchaeota archaeon]MBT4368143.1 hypothetical protein [Candidatus Woesearchaeota archaeon]MBT4712631.1 hypothetical protein [Candidatus Woesearchaeota archaeon]MBT6639544.1 hypothetical protein [Candidatus Woesearchaeota archaeon]MBT7133716.1 hypothetical protein [Candidatus Woesearchaeota archaeon]